MRTLKRHWILKKNSIHVSQSKILIDATIPWEYEGMKNSDEKVNTGAFRNVKKHYVGGGGINAPIRE